MSGWVEKRLGDVCDIIDGDRGTNYPSQSELTSDGFCLFLNTGNVTKTGFNFANNQFISHEKDALLRKGKLQTDDIVMTTRGTIGNVALHSPKVPFENIRINSGMVLLRVKAGLHTKYLYSLLRSYTMQKSIEMYSSGSAQPQLPIKDMRKIKISIPNLPTQTRIADILSAYDSAIENNTRRIALLEKAAREIYREWFVRLRFPGWENAKVVEGVPEGWGMKQLGEIVGVGRGSSPRPITDTKYFSDGNIPWIKIADATKSTKFILETKEYVNEYGASFSRKLPVGTMIIAASGTLGFPMFLGIEGCIHDGWMYFFDVNEISKEYLYFVLLSMGQYYNSISYGAAIQNINTDIIRKSKIIIPSQNVLKQFTNIIFNIDNKIKNLLLQSQNLAHQRNLLLPRLMSGKLEV